MNTQSTPAVVLPTDRPAALGIARSLGRRGIQVYGVDADPHAIGFASKYINACPLPNSDSSDENRLQYLMDLGKKLGGKSVLFPVSDDSVMLCSAHRNELQKHYTYVMTDHETTTDLLTKDGLNRIAQLHDIPHPQMFQVHNAAELKEIAAQLPYPVIIKPVFSPSWLRPEITSLLKKSFLGGAPKVAVCNNANELLELYKKIAVYDDRVIIQEIIPGEDERLVYFCFYMNRQSKPLATFAGEKLRVLPVGFGSASYVRSFHDPKLDEISLKLLSGTQYQGLGGIEFKRDPRDGCYKLIEFNARMGLWDSLSIKCGIDIPYIAYCDTLGLPVETQQTYREGVHWIDFQRDIRAFLIYKRQNQLGFFQWFRSLLGEKEWAHYSSDDWKPAVVAITKLIQQVLSSLIKRVSPFSRRKKNQGNFETQWR